MIPWSLLHTQAFTGLVSCLITFVPVSIIILLFRKSRLRVSHASLLKDVVEEHLDEDLEVFCDKEMQTTQQVREPCQTGPSEDPPAYDVVSGDAFQQDLVIQPPTYAEVIQTSTTEKKKKKKPKKTFVLPWQMRILAWFLLIVGILASAAFTTFYGIGFGDSACKQWLSSLFVSFFVDLCLTQPLKVILFAVFFAFICKRMVFEEELNFVEEDEMLMNSLGRRYRLNHTEEYLHEDYLYGKSRETHAIRPPDPEMLEKSRILRSKERQMYDMLREFIFFFIFFTLLVIVSNGFRDPQATNVRKGLEQLFFPNNFSKVRLWLSPPLPCHVKLQSLSPDFPFYALRSLQINSISHFWQWVEKYLITGLRAQRWYNGDPPVGLRGFLADCVSRIMGFATMRQLRTQEESCTVHEEVQDLVTRCYGQYSIHTQDEKTYLPGWMPNNSTKPPDQLPKEFQYTKAEERNGYPRRGQLTWYSGGGYVHEMRGSSAMLLRQVETLQETGWLDGRTRAIIIEFAVYNPSVNLFGMVNVLFELPGTGGILPSYRIEPANLLSYVNTSQMSFELTCQVFFVLSLVGLLIKEARHLWVERWAYFLSLRSWAQLVIIVGSFAAIAIFAYVNIETKKLTLEFYRSNGNGYANFQMVAFWNEILAYLVALVTFVAILTLLHIFRFNKHVGLLGSVLRYASHDMKYFFLVFGVVFFSFVTTFYLLFLGTLPAYSTFIQSMETSFQIVLGKFDVTSMHELEPLLGPMAFATFTLFIVFIMLNMFVAILTDSFEVVRKDPSLQSNDHEMVVFALARFIVWSGLNNYAWGQRILLKYADNDSGQIYEEREDRQIEELISDFQESVDLFLSRARSVAISAVKDG
ncbi:unnamed protein product [Schistocephalus solidus]|uniref:PKD_channel domain-containing protein n=1 Tax=Schistocephalus solidus TaxID=70667 RepID=A0A183SJ08_SCHSO|nr:unnamed protein product [Schistocephalus solidus]